MERQRPGSAEDKVMANVEVRQSIAPSRVRAVLNAVTRLRVFVHRLRIGVGRVERQTPTNGLAQGHPQRVVIRHTDGVVIGDIA